MQTLCHRCGETASLRDNSGDVTPFCPHCGAPQLIFEPLDTQDYRVLTTEKDFGTLAAPPSRPGTANPRSANAIDWGTALTSAAGVAAAGVLLIAAATRLPVFSLLTWIWITSASLIVLGLYRRRRPHDRMNAAIGARIGIVVGMAMAAAVAATLAVIGMIARYSLHAMAGYDAQIASVMQASMQHAAVTGVDAATLAAMRGFYASPEVAAGIVLSGLLLLLAGIVFYSTIIGALGGLMHTRRTTLH